MGNRAQCAECGDLVVATSARAVIRAGRVGLICADCSGVALKDIPTRRPVSRAERSPIPEAPLAFAPEASGDDSDAIGEDYDAIYVSLESEPSDEYPAYEALESEPTAPFSIAGVAGAGIGGANSSAGLDRASTSGAIEVSPSRSPREDSTPPPAVVVGD